MNSLLNAMSTQYNRKFSENGDLAYKSTRNSLLDLFGLGGAYRSRSDEDCIFLFKKAFDEDEVLALRCLFYLRDCRGGQGERRFFRVIMRWLAHEHPGVILRNFRFIPLMGRWDDFYTFVGTTLEEAAFDFMYMQFKLDLDCKTPSLLAKWLKSENSHSIETSRLGTITRKHFGMTSREYRKALSSLRERLRIVEKLMSQNRWDEIEFDKIPSRAGLIYRNLFAHKEITAERYAAFAKSKTTKVNASVLYPSDVVEAAIRCHAPVDSADRLMVNKYWDNLTDYFKGAIFNGVAVVDTSGSMTSGYYGTAPINVAVALGMYCAEKCNSRSPWYGNYITFSREARLVPIVGIDFVDKVQRIVRTNLCENTNIENVFKLILSTALENHVPQSEMPKNIIIISDMEFDEAQRSWRYSETVPNIDSVMEKCMKMYEMAGYKRPNLIFWNVNARNDTFPMAQSNGVTFVSGYSATLFESIMKEKSGLDLVLEKLNSDRYKDIR